MPHHIRSASCILTLRVALSRDKSISTLCMHFIRLLCIQIHYPVYLLVAHYYPVSLLQHYWELLVPKCFDVVLWIITVLIWIILANTCRFKNKWRYLRIIWDDRLWPSSAYIEYWIIVSWILVLLQPSEEYTERDRMFLTNLCLGLITVEISFDDAEFELWWIHFSVLHTNHPSEWILSLS